jgi:hypothetical protein
MTDRDREWVWCIDLLDASIELLEQYRAQAWSSRHRYTIRAVMVLLDSCICRAQDLGTDAAITSLRQASNLLASHMCPTGVLVEQAKGCIEQAYYALAQAGRAGDSDLA